MKIQLQFGLIFALLLLTPGIRAQDLEPRSYINIPIDQSFLALGYVYSEGNVNVAPAVTLEDAFIRIDGTVAGYAHTFDLAGNAAKVDVIVPHLCANGRALFNGTILTRNTCGLGDVRIRLNYNFWGAPAVSLKEFAKLEKGLVVGASLQVSIPTGHYDDDRLLNIGANRWFVRPEIGASFPWRKWNMEVSFGAKIFSDNDDFFGDKKLEQDLIYNIQTHLIYDLAPGRWLSLNSNYFWGGKTTKGGIRGDDRQENARLGVTYFMAITRQQSIKLLANTSIHTNIGNDAEIFGISWLYRWQ